MVCTIVFLIFTAYTVIEISTLTHYNLDFKSNRLAVLLNVDDFISNDVLPCGGCELFTVG